MAKILKNTTASPISLTDLGISVSANGQVIVTPQDYLLAADSSQIIALIGSGDLVVNDGNSDLSVSEGIRLLIGSYPNKNKILGSDGTEIGNYGDSLKVKIDKSSDTTEIPSISSKLRSDGDFNELTITADAPSWQTAYSYSGSGLLFDFFLDFNSKDVKIKLTIDSEVIFTYTVDEIDSIKVDDRKSPTWLSEDSSNKITFNPRWPIKYTSSVLIEVQNIGNSNKKIERRVVTLTKET